MFLPSNEVDSVKDNTDNVSFVYNIRDKEAHYVSAGSAEIVYDNQAVGDVIAKGIIAEICDELCISNSVKAINEANSWMTSEAVAIQEHEANLLTDSILSLYAPFSVTIGKDTDENTVQAYIFAGAEALNVLDEVKENETKKFESVTAELRKKVDGILNMQNGIGAAKSFLDSLSINIAICKDEMNNEAGVLRKALAYECDWSADISSLRGGIFKTFDKDAAEALQNKLTEYVEIGRAHV